MARLRGVDNPKDLQEQLVDPAVDLALNRDINAPPSLDPTAPTSDPIGQWGETPRERADVQARSPAVIPSPGATTMGPTLDRPGDTPAPAPVTSTPRKPSTPTPMAGSVSTPSSQGVIPFQPIGTPSVGAQATPQLRSLFGSQGGLTGGGLGVPLSPMNLTESGSIDSLIQMLQQRLGR